MLADSLPMKPQHGEGCSHVDILASSAQVGRRSRRSTARALAAAEVTAGGKFRTPFRLYADLGALLLAAIAGNRKAERKSKIPAGHSN